MQTNCRQSDLGNSSPEKSHVKSTGKFFLLGCLIRISKMPILIWQWGVVSYNICANPFSCVSCSMLDVSKMHKISTPKSRRPNGKFQYALAKLHPWICTFGQSETKIGKSHVVAWGNKVRRVKCMQLRTRSWTMGGEPKMSSRKLTTKSMRISRNLHRPTLPNWKKRNWIRSKKAWMPAHRQVLFTKQTKMHHHHCQQQLQQRPLPGFQVKICRFFFKKKSKSDANIKFQNFPNSIQFWSFRKWTLPIPRGHRMFTRCITCRSPRIPRGKRDKGSLPNTRKQILSGHSCVKNMAMNKCLVSKKKILFFFIFLEQDQRYGYPLTFFGWEGVGA